MAADRTGATSGRRCSLVWRLTQRRAKQGEQPLHGKAVSTEVTLDWRPFEYSTIDSYEDGKKMFSETFRLEPLPDGGTRVTNFSQVHLPLPRPIRRIVARLILLNKFKYDQAVQKAAQLAGEEYHRSLNPE
jgi:hypothetical protein